LVSRLHRALIRDLWHLRGQVIATALVVSVGIGAFVTMVSTYQSLARARADYYSSYRFADVFASLKRAPDSLAATLRLIPGVAAVETRVAEDVILSVPGLAEPATGRLISLSRGAESGEGLNRLHLTAGRYPSPRSDDEIVTSQTFARANSLSLGNRIGAVLNGRWKVLKVVGLALSPEYVYEVGPGMVVPDNRRFGVVWMNSEGLATAFNMKGAFNDVSLSLARGASSSDVIDAVDRLLAPHGGFRAYDRSDQPSNRFLTDELAEIEVNATYIPAIFLAVAVFLVYTLLARLITIQRSQIALLKAFGYFDVRIGMHYLEFALLIVGLGLIAGLALGGYFGAGLIGVYQQYFHFPVLRYRLNPSLVLFAVPIALAAAVGGSLTAVQRAVRLPPAEAMRPEPPRSFQAGLLDRVGLIRRLDTVTKAILRNLARRPWRAALSILGIAAAVATVVVGRFMFDAVNALMTVHFDAAEREDVTVTFNETRSRGAVTSLRDLPGVLRVEPFRAMPALIRASHREKRVSVLALPPSGTLRQLIDAGRRRIELPPKGLVLTRKLARLLAVVEGDHVVVEQLDGRRRQFTAAVVRLSDEPVGMSGYMDADALAGLLGEDAPISGAVLQVDQSREPALFASLKRTPAIAAVSIRSATLQTIRDIMNRSFILMTIVMTGFGIILVAGVVYNSERIALSERGNELASLRVLGFTRVEVGQLLLGEQALLTLAAIPAGCALGALICRLLVPAFDRELFRLPFTLTGATFGFASLVTLGSAAAAGCVVAGRIAQLDLIAVLKARE
jgi:putative ABC transport system permease protein